MDAVEARQTYHVSAGHFRGQEDLVVIVAV
jgi:uncharacterized protein (DUF952 family)